MLNRQTASPRQFAGKPADILGASEGSPKISLATVGFAYLTPARWPLCGAIALAKAEGRPLYFLPFFLTAPRATRFCSFSYARRRSISSPPLAAFRARRFSCTISKSCLNSKDARRERTATSSSVTRSGTRRENAFFLRIAIGRQSYHIRPSSQQNSPRPRGREFKS